MFALIAGLVFSAAFLMAAGTIGGMFALYRDKMIAALLFQPLPETPPAYHIQISRRRAQNRGQRHAHPVSRMAGIAA